MRELVMKISAPLDHKTLNVGTGPTQILPYHHLWLFD
jgi:hypothetical protein